ncbi:MAG: G8 domain-containing protein [Nitrososphaerales archaeon]|nr:G8 domain-containing protein [Nitrososphaerales archaeon]
MQKDARRIAVLAAAIVVAAMLGSLLIPQSIAVDQSSAQQILDPLMASQMQGTLTGPRFTSVQSGSWSDPATWGSGIPMAGASVMVASGTTVTYDQATSPLLGNIDVRGNLVFSTKLSMVMTSANITVEQNAMLQVGTVSSPLPSWVTATLQMSALKEGASVIMVMGDLELHGSPLTPTWTRLASTAQAGAMSLTLATAVGWKPGDHIVIASTSLRPQESEEDFVASVSGTTVTLQTPLKFEHDGTAPTQAEVADLTRNIVVTSANTAIHAQGPMFLAGAQGGISYAEFSHLGAQGIVGEYPIHFHHVQETMVGTIINGISVWDSHNRFVTIHNTDGITVENSVGYKSVGHGFFLEDGTEENNTLANDLAILTLPGKIRPDDGGAAGFWVQNPMNNLTGDVAVSAAGNGFDFALPESAPQVIPFKQVNFDASVNQATVPRSLQIQAFVNNEAHSNGGDGFHLYRINMVQRSPISWFKDMTMWRNDRLGADITAARFNVTSSTFFGNAFGNLRIEANDGTVTQSQFMGELQGVSTGTAIRFATAPFGIEVAAGTAAISNSVFSGHLPRGTVASADILNSPIDLSPEAVTVINDQLESPNAIVFGYPLNGMSFFNVINLNGAADQSFSLVRYDLQSAATLSSVPASSGLQQFLAQCSPDSSYMALKCPVVTASILKSLRG